MWPRQKVMPKFLWQFKGYLPLPRLTFPCLSNDLLSPWLTATMIYLSHDLPLSRELQQSRYCSGAWQLRQRRLGKLVQGPELLQDTGQVLLTAWEAWCPVWCGQFWQQSHYSLQPEWVRNSGGAGEGHRQDSMEGSEHQHIRRHQDHDRHHVHWGERRPPRCAQHRNRAYRWWIHSGQ